MGVFFFSLPALAGYIASFKFGKEEKILVESSYPILKGWVASTEELWVGVPKCKIVKLHLVLHGLTQNQDSEALEVDKLRMDEKIKNALERDDMDIAGVGTINIVGDTILRNLDSFRGETFVQAELWSVRFTAGNR